MKVEIHAHTDVYSTESRIPPPELIQMAEASGYDAVFITEHNRVWPRREFACLKELCDRLVLLPGIQVTLAEVDMLVLGAADPSYERLTKPSDLLAQACADGFLTVLIPRKPQEMAFPEYCALCDAIEVRSCAWSSPEQMEAAERYSEKHHAAPVYGADAYGLNYLNKFWIETTTPFSTPQEFRHAVISGNYVNRTRAIHSPLPPIYKTQTMAELSEADSVGLLFQPTA